MIALMATSLVAGSVSVLAGGCRHDGHYCSPFRHHHDDRLHRSHLGAYLPGGVLLGSVHADAYDRSNSPERVCVERRLYYGPYVVYRESTTVRVLRPVRRSLLKDLRGNCFETESDSDGDERRTKVSASECGWSVGG